MGRGRIIKFPIKKTIKGSGGGQVAQLAPAKFGNVNEMGRKRHNKLLRAKKIKTRKINREAYNILYKAKKIR